MGRKKASGGGGSSKFAGAENEGTGSAAVGSFPTSCERNGLLPSGGGSLLSSPAGLVGRLRGEVDSSAGGSSSIGGERRATVVVWESTGAVGGKQQQQTAEDNEGDDERGVMASVAMTDMSMRVCGVAEGSRVVIAAVGNGRGGCGTRRWTTTAERQASSILVGVVKLEKSTQFRKVTGAAVKEISSTDAGGGGEAAVVGLGRAEVAKLLGKERCLRAQLHEGMAKREDANGLSRAGGASWSAGVRNSVSAARGAAEVNGSPCGRMVEVWPLENVSGGVAASVRLRVIGRPRQGEDDDECSASSESDDADADLDVNSDDRKFGRLGAGNRQREVVSSASSLFAKLVRRYDLANSAGGRRIIKKSLDGEWLLEGSEETLDICGAKVRLLVERIDIPPPSTTTAAAAAVETESSQSTSRMKSSGESLCQRQLEADSSYHKQLVVKTRVVAAAKNRICQIVSGQTEIFVLPPTVGGSDAAAYRQDGKKGGPAPCSRGGGTAAEAPERTGLDRVGGLRSVVDALRRLVVWPLTNPSVYRELGVRPPKGVLLYGPPGGGKTLIARCLAEEVTACWQQQQRRSNSRATKMTTQRTEKNDNEKYINDDHDDQDTGEQLRADNDDDVDEEENRDRLHWLPPVVEFVDVTDLTGKFVGEAEKNIAELFEKARRRLRDPYSPRGTLIFIDEIDAVCPKREGSGEMERRMVTAFLTQLDGSRTENEIVLLGATNRPDALDPAIRRAGRLDSELEVGVPTATERLEILTKLLHGSPHSLLSEDIAEIAEDCQAFVGADLRALVSAAAMVAIERRLANTRLAAATTEDRSDCADNGRPEMTRRDFDVAIKDIKPSAMKELSVDVPSVKWTDIGGYEAEKQKLRECVEWPIVHAKFFRDLRLAPPRGILLYGPPGCSKTLLAKAVATESKMNFTSVKGPELLSKWVGESERAVRELFRRARQNAPCVVFFDEVDALGVNRSSAGGSSGVEARVLSQMLNEMDGIAPVKQVVVIGATNRPDLLDDALLRPGRFDRLIYIPLPDKTARSAILKVHMRGIPTRAPETATDGSHSEKALLEFLVEATKSYSGAELAMVCREASMLAIRERLENKFLAADNSSVVVEDSHFKAALQAVKPRIRKQLLQFYEKYAAKR